MFLIFSAFAQEAGTAVSPQGGFDFRGLIPFVLVIAVMYFFILRPQQKKMKQHQALIANVRRGDRILTAGGLIGVVHKVVNNEEIILELDEGIRVRLIKTAISQVLAKTEPIPTSEGDKNNHLTPDLLPTAEEGATVVKLEKKSPKRKNLPKL